MVILIPRASASEYSHHYSGYKIHKFDLMQFYLKHLEFSKVLTDTPVILKDMFNEKFTFKQSNLRKSHATRLKSVNKMPFILYHSVFLSLTGVKC